MEIAKMAAILFLKSLPFNSKFNIISFGTDTYKLFPESMLSNLDNVSVAINEISKMSANMSGNDIHKALLSIFLVPADIEYPRSLFLLTDGGESNFVAPINLIKSNATKCRIHGFGIEARGRDAQFIQDAADLGNGYANFIYNMDELGAKVINSLSKCAIPCMNKWEIN